MADVSQSDPATTLCTRCGLCCDGYLHSYAVLREAEMVPAAALGLPVLTDGRCGFALPCPKLVDRCCSIYGERPKGCADYKCRLLNKLDTGNVMLNDALAIVDTAREMAAIYEQNRTSPTQLGTIVAAQHKLQQMAFYLHIDKHFLNPNENSLIMEESVTYKTEELP